MFIRECDILIRFPYAIIKYKIRKSRMRGLDYCVRKSNVWRSDYHARKSNLQWCTVKDGNCGNCKTQFLVLFCKRKKRKIEKIIDLDLAGSMVAQQVVLESYSSRTWSSVLSSVRSLRGVLPVFPASLWVFVHFLKASRWIGNSKFPLGVKVMCGIYVSLLLQLSFLEFSNKR